MTKPIRMVDVSAKPDTLRQATARAELHADPKVIAAIRSRRLPKGDVFSAAEIAGIQAAKRTAEWIPLCHPLKLTHVDVDCRLDGSRVIILAKATAREATGVEMEALTAAAAAALTVYDMTKSLDRGMRIANLCLLEKSGGRSGTWRRKTSKPKTVRRTQCSFHNVISSPEGARDLALKDEISRPSASK